MQDKEIKTVAGLTLNRPEKAMSKGSILVIDDELIICNLLCDVLKDRGYAARYCLSGEDGIRQAKEYSFDVVMTDLKMPDMDGIKVLKEIKSLDPENVVIVITGYSSFETIQAALRSGAYDYITKPFNIDDISFLIERAVAFRNLTLTKKRLMKETEEQNIRLEEKVRERTKELTLLYRIGRDVSSTLRLEEVLDITVERVTKILDVEICSILLIDNETKELVIKASCGLDEKVVKQTRIRMDEPIEGWVIQHKEAILVEDIEIDPRFSRKSLDKYYTPSFISAPLIAKGEVIGVINVNNKRSRDVFTKNDLRFIKGIASEVAIAIDNARLYSRLEESYMHTVMALTFAIDAKDHYTLKHSEHVANYAVAIAKEMSQLADDIENIKQACLLHDIGKIGVRDHILVKPDKLTPEESTEMKIHSTKSAEILRPLSFLGEVIDLVEQHHERYDGTGYPHGLKADNIKLGARVMAVADSFDAMVTDRPYRKALSKEEAISELKKVSGIQFDPKVVEVFLKVLAKNPEIIQS